MYLINGSLTQGGCDCLSFIIPFLLSPDIITLSSLDRGGMWRRQNDAYSSSTIYFESRKSLGRKFALDNELSLDVITPKLSESTGEWVLDDNEGSAVVFITRLQRFLCFDFSVVNFSSLPQIFSFSLFKQEMKNYETMIHGDGCKKIQLVFIILFLPPFARLATNPIAF